MPGPEEGGLPAADELFGTGPEPDREELHAGMLHMTGLADRRRPQPREDLPDVGELKQQMGF